MPCVIAPLLARRPNRPKMKLKLVRAAYWHFLQLTNPLFHIYRTVGKEQAKLRTLFGKVGHTVLLYSTVVRVCWGARKSFGSYHIYSAFVFPSVWSFKILIYNPSNWAQFKTQQTVSIVPRWGILWAITIHQTFIQQNHTLSLALEIYHIQ